MLKGLPPTVRHTFYYDFKAGILFGIFGGLFLPFIPIIGRKIGASESQIALLTAAPYLANAFALLWTEDVLGKGRVWYVVWPNVFGRALLFGMFLVVSPFYYTLLIFLYMVITAIPFPSYASVMKTNYPEAQRGRLMSYVRVGNAIPWIVASTLGGWVLQRGTDYYQYLFPIAAVFGILSALEFGRIKVRREKRVKERVEGLTHLTAPFQDRVFRHFIITYTLFEFGLLLGLPLYPLVLVDEVHIPNLVAGIYGSIYSALWLAGFFFWGHFIDRHTTARTLSMLAIAASMMPLIYLLSRDLWFLGVAQAMAGFTFSAIELVGYVVITRMASPREVPRYMAVHIALGGLRGATAPFLGMAMMTTYGASVAFGLSLFLIILGLFSAIRKS